MLHSAPQRPAQPPGSRPSRPESSDTPRRTQQLQALRPATRQAFVVLPLHRSPLPGRPRLGIALHGGASQCMHAVTGPFECEWRQGGDWLGGASSDASCASAKRLSTQRGPPPPLQARRREATRLCRASPPSPPPLRCRRRWLAGGRDVCHSPGLAGASTLRRLGARLARASGLRDARRFGSPFWGGQLRRVCVVHCSCSFGLQQGITRASAGLQRASEGFPSPVASAVVPSRRFLAPSLFCARSAPSSSLPVQRPLPLRLPPSLVGFKPSNRARHVTPRFLPPCHPPPRLAPSSPRRALQAGRHILWVVTLPALWAFPMRVGGLGLGCCAH